MKLRDIKNFEKFETADFIVFLTALIIMGISAYILTLNSSNEMTFIGWYAFCGGMSLICITVYVYPLIRDRYSPTGKYRPDPQDVLLIGIDGSRPIIKKRELEDLIRRNRI